MPDAKGEAGDLTGKPTPGVAAAKGEAGSLSSAVGVGASVAEAVGSASGSTVVKAEAGAIVMSQTEVQLKIGRAPFSPHLIAERLEADPEHYQRLAQFAASELDREIARYTGQGNSQEVIRGELIRLQTGFTDLALQIGAKAYGKAADVVIGLRDGLVSWSEAHPEL